MDGPGAAAIAQSQRTSGTSFPRDIPTFSLNDGSKQPALGYGTYKVGFVPASASGAAGTSAGQSDDAAIIVAAALKTGYRFYDCAQFYGNERAVGKAIKDSGIKRTDLYLASKVWNDTVYRGTAAVREQVAKTLRDLQTDYLDLYLVHWPVPNKHIEAYKALEALQREGKVRSIGVSNYTIEDYKELMGKDSGVTVKPAVNQLEVNPFLYRKTTIDFFAKEGVLIQAYRALRQGKEFGNALLVGIARKHGKSEAQILGRWCHQKGIAYITKSVKTSRMLQNAQIFDFELDRVDMERLGHLTTEDNLKAFRALYMKCVVRDTPLEKTNKGVKARITVA